MRKKSFFAMTAMSTLRSLCSLILIALFTACATSPAKQRQAQLRGQKVALVSSEGPEMARLLAEVALVNHLSEKGNFILIPKQEVEKSKASADASPFDLRALAQDAGADFALHLKVTEFSAQEIQIHKKERVYDSVIAEEQGKKSGVIERNRPQSRLSGAVEIEFHFYPVASSEHWISPGSARREIQSSPEAPLPLKYTFLEKLVSEAIEATLKKQ
jgi:hypothetical protein